MWSRCRLMRGSFLERIEKPDVDVIDGIAPAVAIRQKNTTRNPRSTVATATEIYDYLRLLFARVGRTYCSQCGNEVKKDTVDEVAAAVLGLGDGARLNVLFPLVSGTVSSEDGKARGGKERRAAGARAGRPRDSQRDAGATGWLPPRLQLLRMRLRLGFSSCGRGGLIGFIRMGGFLSFLRRSRCLI